MDLDIYQQLATKTADYPDVGNNLVYPALGLAGEAGETAEKVKKAWRNYGAMSAINIKSEDKMKIIKEMGDTLWYLAAMCNELQIDMNDVALVNLTKLEDRKLRSVIKSSGDNR